MVKDWGSKEICIYIRETFPNRNGGSTLENYLREERKEILLFKAH